MRGFNTILAQSLLCTLFLSGSVFGEDEDRRKGIQVGERAPVTGVRFAVGEWSVDHKMTCPAARYGTAPKIAVYTTVLNENILKLAHAIENRIVADESLKWSFIAVSDQKGAHHSVESPKYYTREQSAERLKEIKELASEKGIRRTTIGITAHHADLMREKLAMPENANVLVTFQDGNKQKSRVVRYVAGLNATELNTEKIDAVLARIDQIRSR